MLSSSSPAMQTSLTQPRAAAAGAGNSVTRFPCSGTVQAVCCLPRAAVASGLSFGVGGGAAAASASGGLDANLHAVHADQRGDGSLISLRSLLSPAQIERARRQQAEAAEDAAEAAARGLPVAATAPLGAVDPAPILASYALPSCGGVSRLLALSDRLVIASTGDGGCVMLEVAQGEAGADGGLTSAQRRVRGGGAAYGGASAATASSLQLRPAHTFSNLHVGATTALAVQLSSSTPLAATCSDDGSLSLLAPFARSVLRRVAHAHPSSLFALCFGDSHTLHAGGMGGSVSSFDLREPSGGQNASGLAKPAAVLFDPNAVSVTSLATHPTRSHLLAVGSSNGSISIFDIRRTGGTAASVTPLSSIQAQRAAVLDMSFLPWSPQQLLAASEDGSLCCFSFGAGSDPAAAALDGDAVFESRSVDRNMKPAKLLQNASALRTISLDRETRTVLCGSDTPSLLSLQL